MAAPGHSPASPSACRTPAAQRFVPTADLSGHGSDRRRLRPVLRTNGLAGKPGMIHNLG
jgi:hypothetical protein